MEKKRKEDKTLMATEDEINQAITRNMERRWVVGVQGEHVIINNYDGLGACKISQEHWPDLKLVIETLLPGAIPNV
jgi:hypothetical protein